MKKKLLALTLTGALAMSLLAGCGGSSDDTATTDTTTTEDTAATEDTDAAEAETASGEGSVYYLNFKPERTAACRRKALLLQRSVAVLWRRERCAGLPVHDELSPDNDLAAS